MTANDMYAYVPVRYGTLEGQIPKRLRLIDKF